MIFHTWLLEVIPYIRLIIKIQYMKKLCESICIIVEEIIFFLLGNLILWGILASFVIWWIVTGFFSVLEKFLVAIYPLTKALLPPLVASIAAGTLYVFTQNIPFKDIGVLYLIIWVLVYSILYAWVEQIKWKLAWFLFELPVFSVGLKKKRSSV